MSYNNTFYLHFVTDLRRVVFCLNNNNPQGAKTFLTHANSIYERFLKQVMDGEKKELNFNENWSEIYKKDLPTEKAEIEKYCEKILTLSSMIFLRSTKDMSITSPSVSVVPQKEAAAV